MGKVGVRIVFIGQEVPIVCLIVVFLFCLVFFQSRAVAASSEHDSLSWIQEMMSRNRPVEVDPSAPSLEAITNNLHRLEEILEDSSNVRIPIGSTQLKGFAYDRVVFYRAPSVIIPTNSNYLWYQEGNYKTLLEETSGTSSRSNFSGNGTVTATIDVDGEYYPAFVLYDVYGTEEVALYVNGELKGVAKGIADNNRQHLVALPERVKFSSGDTLQLSVVKNEFQVRIEDIVLLKELPAKDEVEWRISNIDARPWEFLSDGDFGAISVTWRTNWPANYILEYGRTPEYGETIKEDYALYQNHRVILHGLDAGTYHYRIRTTTPDGTEISTEDRTFLVRERVTEVVSNAKGEIPLELKAEDMNIPDGWVVTSGIPFPEGMVYSTDRVGLFDSNSNQVLCQKDVLARWPDDSIKWLLLSFKAGDGTKYSLRYGDEYKDVNGPTVKVEQDSNGVMVDTGVLKFRVAGKNGKLLDNVSYIGEDGKWRSVDLGQLDVEVMDSKGLLYLASQGLASVEVEERGPVRTVIRLSGVHKNHDNNDFFAYVMRIMAYAGEKYLRVYYTIENNYTHSDFVGLGRVNMNIPFISKEFSIAQIMGEDEFITSERLTSPVTLTQMTDLEYETRVDNKVQAKSGKAEGWLVVANDKDRVVVSVRDFWQNYPKSVSVSSDGIELGLFPELERNQYDEWKGTEDEHKLYYYMRDGKYNLKQGVSKTHEILIKIDEADEAKGQSQGSGTSLFQRIKSSLFGGGTAQKADPELVPFITAFQRPPVLAADPKWYINSGVVGNIALPGDDELTKLYDTLVSRAFSSFLTRRQANREYGLLNYGDWWGERDINWGNLEYDTAYSFFIQFMRTGDMRYFYAAELAAVHNRDVDVVHYNSDWTKVGGVWMHSIGHVGGYYATSPVPGQGSPNTLIDMGHSWVGYNFLHYFLTGDRRSYEVALKIADRYATVETRAFDFTLGRQAGWTIIMMMNAYESTNDALYLNAAEIIVERVLERQAKDGAWRRTLGHRCPCQEQHLGHQAFLTGILLSSLKRYHLVTGDEQVKDAIIRGANSLINDMWLEDEKVFNYTSCPELLLVPSINPYVADGLGYAFSLTNDSRIGKVLAESMEKGIESSWDMTRREDLGKRLSACMYFLPGGLFALYK